MVDAKLDLFLLIRKNVITENLKVQIESSDNRNAKEILFHHLRRNSDVAALRECCQMAVAADAFPNMQKLGQKMLSELLSGLLEWCLVWCVCVCVCVCVYACVHASGLMCAVVL